MLFNLYIFTIVILLFYSFTQIDLNLTLSQIPIWQNIEHFSKNIGYFQRPLSTALFILILFSLFGFYLYFLKLASSRKITRKKIWQLILFTSLILVFSYNAFSYDLFNYIFDAKIVTFYNQNPYEHKALDYQGDPMLSFMHWTHRTYPYGPSWLFLTVPLSILGLNFFLPTLLLFKALATAGFLGTVYFIGKILKKFSANNETFGLVFFALNPLIIIESLVSAHLDIAMAFFGVSALYLLMRKKYITSFLSLIFSIGVKFATLFLLPVFFWVMFNKNKINWEKVFIISTILITASVVLASFRTNFQPWYLVSVLPFATLLSKKYFILIPSLVISFFSLLIYVPFLYTGNWNPPIPTILFWITTTGIIVSLVLVILRKSKILLWKF